MFKPLMMTALIFAAVPAFAEDAPAAPTVRVTAADLDLSSESGRATLDRRIDSAIRFVCSDAEYAPRSDLLNSNGRCRATARSVARSQRDALVAAVAANR